MASCRKARGFIGQKIYLIYMLKALAVPSLEISNEQCNRYAKTIDLAEALAAFLKN